MWTPQFSRSFAVLTASIASKHPNVKVGPPRPKAISFHVTECDFTMNTEAYDETSPKPKGKHISSACSVCRVKKIRCDGALPKCSHCILYDKDCVYKPTEDKRKEKRKDKTAALEARIELLESLLLANGIPIPPAEIASSNPQITPALALPLDKTLLTQAVGKLDSPASSATDDALVDQLSGRMGSLQLADDGQLRFYGPTSNLTILQNGTLSLGTSSRVSVAENWPDILARAGVGHVVDTELEDHLIKL